MFIDEGMSAIFKCFLLHLHEIVEGYIFSLQFVCVCVYVSVCLSLNKISAKYIDAPIGTRLSLDGCLSCWLRPFRKRSRSLLRNIHFFLHNSLLTFLIWISAILYSIKKKFGMPLTYNYGKFVYKFHKDQIGDDVIGMLSKFSPNDCPCFKFY